MKKIEHCATCRWVQAVLTVQTRTSHDHSSSDRRQCGTVHASNDSHRWISAVFWQCRLVPVRAAIPHANTHHCGLFSCYQYQYTIYSTTAYICFFKIMPALASTPKGEHSKFLEHVFFAGWMPFLLASCYTPSHRLSVCDGDGSLQHLWWGSVARVG